MSRPLRHPVTDATAVSVPLYPGDYRLSLPAGDLTRTFLVHVPPQALDDLPLPVVINFHGGGSNADQQRRYSAMDATADRHGFIVIYPNGTGVTPRQRRLLTFNAGGCCPPATRNRVDDVGFAETILAVVGEKTGVDTRRLYATGMSNGGMMAHRMAADSPRIAAVASVAGQLNVTSFRPSKPVSVMEFHSVDDGRAPFGNERGAGPSPGRLLRRFPPVQTGIDQWVAHNECPPTPVVGETVLGRPGSLNEGQSVTRFSYGPGRDGVEVVLYKFTGSGHVWPGSPTSLPRLLGAATTLVDANETMWQFFAAHPLSEDR